MKKILGFIKGNWSEILVVFVFIAVSVVAWRQHTSLSLYDNLMKSYNQQSEDFNKQIAELNKAQEDNKKVKEKLERDYQENLKNLDQKYKTDFDKLSKKLLSDRQVLIKEGIDNPCKLLDMFVEIYGSEKFTGVMTECQ
jgi:lipid II:glycine glycyltransferase (peptidoglycan interpeptide bridge formation enzyme)